VESDVRKGSTFYFSLRVENYELNFNLDSYNNIENINMKNLTIFYLSLSSFLSFNALTDCKTN
jgi:hypothetical protein